MTVDFSPQKLRDRQVGHKGFPGDEETPSHKRGGPSYPGNRSTSDQGPLPRGDTATAGTPVDSHEKGRPTV